MNQIETSKVKSHHRGVESARFSDVLAFASTISAVSIGIYLIHGALKNLSKFPYGSAQSLAQLFGILATLSALYGIVLAARPRYIEHSVGLDVMLVWHRVLGEACAIFLLIHIALEYYTRSRFGGLVEAFKALTGRDGYMALATVGALGFFIVTISSLKAIRRRLSYESWYFIHLLIYGSTLMGFWHQIYLGNDFFGDKTAKYFWIGIHLFTLLVLLQSRFFNLFRAWVKPLRVRSVDEMAHDTLVITLEGGRLKKMKAESGQFALLRFLTKDLWFESHPFSLSAAPKKEALRFTIKMKGDGTRLLRSLRRGSRVVLEGPYGAIVKSQIKKEPTVLIAGGVGIAPIRALLEDFTPSNQPYLLFRVKSKEDIIHLDELRELCTRNNGKMFIVEGATAKLPSNPFSAENLKSNIPNIELRQAILCGPESMIVAGVKGLMKAGVPYESIHYERSWW